MRNTHHDEGRAPERQTPEEAAETAQPCMTPDEKDAGEGGRIDHEEDQRVAQTKLAEDGDNAVTEQNEEGGDAPGDAKGQGQEGDERLVG
jgi:hypothetical protein